MQFARFEQPLLGLTVLKQIADKHRVSIPNIAVDYILGRPAVAGRDRRYTARYIGAHG